MPRIEIGRAKPLALLRIAHDNDPPRLPVAAGGGEACVL